MYTTNLSHQDFKSLSFLFLFTSYILIIHLYNSISTELETVVSILRGECEKGPIWLLFSLALRTLSLSLFDV